MPVTLVIIILIGGAVIAFFVRFLIALYQESRCHGMGHVKMVYEGYTVLSPKPDRHTRSRLDGANGDAVSGKHAIAKHSNRPAKRGCV
jgi:hypothetical protein